MRLEEERLKNIKEQMVLWIRNKFSEIGGKRAVIGISGGKDSTVVAKIMAEALGSQMVYGLLLPNGCQEDLQDGIDICKAFSINYKIIDIRKAYDSFIGAIEETGLEIKRQTELNLPPRIRMAMLYAYSQSLEDALVINTSNLSEDWVGYATIYGDTAGAISPLATLTSEEVVELGRYLGIEERFIGKKPADGLTGKTDEDVLGFTYKDLNTYIREGKIGDRALKEKIDKLHRISRFKFQTIAMFDSGLEIKAKDIAGIYKNL